MEIVWTRLAKITFKEVLENLHLRWTKNETKNFIGSDNFVIQQFYEVR